MLLPGTATAWIQGPQETTFLSSPPQAWKMNLGWPSRAFKVYNQMCSWGWHHGAKNVVESYKCSGLAFIQEREAEPDVGVSWTPGSPAQVHGCSACTVVVPRLLRSPCAKRSHPHVWHPHISSTHVCHRQPREYPTHVLLFPGLSVKVIPNALFLNVVLCIKTLILQQKTFIEVQKMVLMGLNHVLYFQV